MTVERSPRLSKGASLGSFLWASEQEKETSLWTDIRIQGAQEEMEAAVSVSINAGASCTDGQLGQAYCRLGQVYWSLGGKLREDRSYAHKQWLASAALWGPYQVAV